MANDYIIVMDKFGGAHLEHRSYKYLKREWKNGKWKYTYDAYGEAWGDGKRYNQMKANELRQKGFTKAAESYEKDAMKARYQEFDKKAKQAREVHQAIKKWEKTPISKLQTAYHKSIDSMPARIEKGKKIIDSLLSKLKKKVNETAISAGKKLGLKTQQVETRTDISTGQKWKRVNGGPWEKVK